MTEKLCGFWTPPGPLGEIDEIGGYVELRNRVGFARQLLVGDSQASAEAVQSCDSIIAELNVEIDGRIRDLVNKLPKAA